MEIVEFKSYFCAFRMINHFCDKERLSLSVFKKTDDVICYII